MFTENECEYLDIGLSLYIDSENERLKDLYEDIEYWKNGEHVSMTDKYMKDDEEAIESIKERISRLELLKVKVIQYKLGIKV